MMIRLELLTPARVIFLQSTTYKQGLYPNTAIIMIFFFLDSVNTGDPR